MRFADRKHSMNLLLMHNENLNTVSIFSVGNIVVSFELATDPFVIGQIMDAGVFQVLFFAILILFLNQASFNVFANTWLYADKIAFPGIWSTCFGELLCKLPIFLIIIGYLDFTIFHSSEISSYFIDIVTTLAPDLNDIIITNKWFTNYFITILFCIPTLFITTLKNMRYLAFIKNSAMILAIICLIAEFIEAMSKEEPPEYTYWNATIQSASDCLTNLLLSYFVHPVVLSYIPALENPTTGRAIKMTWVTSIITGVYTFAAVFLSYGINPDIELDSNIFFSMEHNDIPVVAGKIMTLIIALCSMMIYSHYAANALVELYFSSDNVNKITSIVAGIVVVTFSIAFNFTSELAIEMFDFISVSFLIIIAFILPPVFYLKLFRFNKRLTSSIAVVIFICGVFFFVLTVNDYFG